MLKPAAWSDSSFFRIGPMFRKMIRTSSESSLRVFGEQPEELGPRGVGLSTGLSD